MHDWMNECIVPVADVHVTAISADGSQSAVEPGGDVYLQQGTDRGVGCVVKTDGTRTPATVSIQVGTRPLSTAQRIIIINSSRHIGLDSKLWQQPPMGTVKMQDRKIKDHDYWVGSVVEIMFSHDVHVAYYVFAGHRKHFMLHSMDYFCTVRYG